MSLISSVLDLVFPRTCGGCGHSISSEPGHICWDCLSQLKIIHAPFCSRCGNPVDGDIDDSTKQIAIGVRDLYFGDGLGSDLKSSKNTTWGLLNAVTEYVDLYRKAKGEDNRLNAIWYGRGAQIKNQAFDSIMKLATQQ